MSDDSSSVVVLTPADSDCEVKDKSSTVKDSPQKPAENQSSTPSASMTDSGSEAKDEKTSDMTTEEMTQPSDTAAEEKRQPTDATREEKKEATDATTEEKKQPSDTATEGKQGATDASPEEKKEAADTSTEVKEEATDTSTQTKEAPPHSNTKDDKSPELVPVGMLAESKDLYAKVDDNGNRSWTDKRPEDLDVAAENEGTKKYAVIVRKKKPKEADSTNPLVIDSIIIQSPHLKDVLSNVLKDYPGISTAVSRLTINAPFQCFVHRWHLLTGALEDPKLDSVARSHVKLLIDILEGELGSIIQLKQDYLKNQVVPFEHIWTLFPPGCIVWSEFHGKPFAVRFRMGYVVKNLLGTYHSLQCEMIDWDGYKMGWSVEMLKISSYEGTLPFTELPCYPLEYHKDRDLMEMKLKARGRIFEDLAGFRYKSYKGTALWYPPRNDDKRRKEAVQSRIVIDGSNWGKAEPDFSVLLDRRLRDSGQSSAPTVPGDGNESLHTDYSLPESTHDEEDESTEPKKPKLTDEELMLTCMFVRGYALKLKLWMEFFVDDVDDVVFNEQAFESLVLPEDQKELVLAFAQSQIKYKDSFDDLISGKGKGIIMLLSGGPGIGKTLTAESVAEEMKVPLYVMSAGDLGFDAMSIENNLTRVLQIVAKWNAVLLLDECDVFLEARSAHEMERNRVVSIFLRTLEYYEGILFLTTNRAENIDPAFQSRIHISLEYPPLNTRARASVWKTFLGRTVAPLEDAPTNIKTAETPKIRPEGEAEEPKVRPEDEGKTAAEPKVPQGKEVDDETAATGQQQQQQPEVAHTVTAEEIDRLSLLDLNGRQIKNVLKAANLLACHKREKLGYEHVQKVLKVETRFRNHDMSGLYC